VELHFIDNLNKFRMMAVIRYFLLVVLVFPMIIIAKTKFMLSNDAFNIVLYIVCPSEVLNGIITIIYVLLAVKTGKLSRIDEIYRDHENEAPFQDSQQH